MSRAAGKKTFQTYTDAPYVRGRLTTADIMYIVVLALLPCAGTGMYHYGFHAALLIGISVAAAIAAEFVCDLVLRRSSVWDYSCVVTGLIGGLILPPAAPLWYAVLLPVLAIVVFKHAFGGLGRNLFNPAMAAKFVLTLLFYQTMSDYGTWQYTEAAPLVMLTGGETPSLTDMLTGNTAGCIGTASAAAVLVSAGILLLMGIIDLYIPAAAVLTFALCYMIGGEYGLSFYTQCVQICGGSFLFTVFIMAEDYTTSPISGRARIVYGILLGAGVFLFRQLGFAESACVFALLIADAVRPLLDARLGREPFGARASRWVIRERRRRPRPRPEKEQEHVLSNEALDEEFGRFEEQIERQVRGLEAARLSGDDSLLREAMAEPKSAPPGVHSSESAEPSPSGPVSAYPSAPAGTYPFESAVTDTSAIDLTAIREAIDAGEEESWEGHTSWNMYGQAFTPRTPSAREPAPRNPTGQMFPSGNPSAQMFSPGDTSAQESAPRASSGQGRRALLDEEDEVSRDTDMWEVAEILRAERELHRENEDEFSHLQFMDLDDRDS